MKIVQTVQSLVLTHGQTGRDGGSWACVLCMRKVRPIYVAVVSLESFGSLSTGSFFVSYVASL